MIEALPLLMLVVLALALFSGYPAALVLIGVAAVFAAIGIAVGEISAMTMKAFPLRAYGLFSDNLVFPAIPPLIFMGVALARSGLAEDLFKAIAHALRRVPARLTIATLLVGLLMAPSAGLTGAAVSILALSAMPSMLKAGYPHALATAAVGASGTLGVILPPAIMLFFLAEFAEVPIAGMFSGVVGPAFLLISGYITYFVVAGRSVGDAGQEDVSTSTTRNGRRLWRAALPPVLLIAGVLAAILTGIATPSQSGSIGAAGAALLVTLQRKSTRARLGETLVETGLITAMICFLILGASAFSFVFRLLDGDALFASGLKSLGLGSWGSLLVILLIIFVLGFFIDWIEIVLITLPIFMPVIAKLDFAFLIADPVLVKIWVAVAIAIVLQTSFLTPPFGFALFYLRAAAPPEVKLADIYRGAVPIVAIQLAVLALVLAFPQLSLVIARQFVN